MYVRIYVVETMFSSHGNFNIKTDGNIIVICLSGSFNDKSVIEFISEVKLAFKHLNGEQFGILLNAIDAEGVTPEVYREIDKYNVWLNHQNIVAKAIVSQSPTLHQTSELLIPSRTPQNMKRFEKVEPAYNWLKGLFK